MFTHALMFKFRDPEVCAEEVGKRLLALQPHLTGLISMTYAVDALHTKRSYDAILYVTFENEEAYRAYDKDEEHNKVRVYIHEHVVESHTVDFAS